MERRVVVTLGSETLVFHSILKFERFHAGLLPGQTIVTKYQSRKGYTGEWITEKKDSFTR